MIESITQLVFTAIMGATMMIAAVGWSREADKKERAVRERDKLAADNKKLNDELTVARAHLHFERYARKTEQPKPAVYVALPSDKARKRR